jgi:CheY-like chemotaxis protein
VSLARLVIALSSRSVSRSTLEQLGVVALLYKPFEMSLLQRYLVVMQQLLQGDEPLELVPHQEKLFLGEAGVGSIRILVVDDHAEVARTIRQCLECEPAYDVRIAEDGLEALEQCLSWQPQCIVTDLLMPWMNGYQVMRSLLAGQSRYVPAFVVLSALPQHEMPLHPDYLRGKEIVFVEKPFHMDQLLNAVEQVLTQ